jgi:quinol monooxygenase YgiN
MLIIAGALHVDPADRERYLTAVAGVARLARLARSAPGCHDFVQAPDPIDPGRINIYERWESDEDLHRFRSSGSPSDTADPEPPTPAIHAADIHKYRISTVEAP